MKRNKGYIDEGCLAILAIVAIVVLLGVAIYYSSQADEATRQRGYVAWVKQTGNPKQLSYQEWKDLIESTKKSDDTTVYAPVYIQSR